MTIFIYIVLFSIEQNLTFLSILSTIFVNGTFYSLCPKVFKQLFIAHGHHRNIHIPLASCTQDSVQKKMWRKGNFWFCLGRNSTHTYYPTQFRFSLFLCIEKYFFLSFTGRILKKEFLFLEAL